MGHIANMRNQFKSMNAFERSYDNIYYIIGPVVQEKILKFCDCTFCNFVIIANVERCGLSIWINLNPFYRRILFAKYGWNWPSGSGEEDFYNLSTYFRNFAIISPWKKEGAFIWINLNPLNPRILYAKFGWNWSSGSGEEDFFNLSTYFRNFAIISSLKKEGPFIWMNLNSLHPKMICARFGWN